MNHQRPSTSARQTPPSNQLKLINPNSYVLMFTVWYNWYNYYLHKMIAKCDLYKIIIGLSVVTTLVAFFLSVSVFLQVSSTISFRILQ